MASTRGNPPPNLATLVLVKQRMNAKNNAKNGVRLAPPPPAATGAHSDERLTYRQDPSNTAVPPADTTDPPKISRKTKQLEVSQLDKKMDEINRKQELKTNEAKDTWKGFDSLNYGFSPGGAQNPTPVPPETTKQVNYSFFFKLKILFIHF
jgi:hypothetical protein